MLTEKLTRGDSIALTKGLLIAAWRFCHNELALSVSHSLASSPKGRALSPSLKPLRRYHDRPEQRGDITTTSTAPHTCQPVARSSRTAPAVQGGTSTSDAIDQTRNARTRCRFPLSKCS